MTDLSLPLLLLALHFVGDFLLQSNWMALNKSKGGWPLVAHCFVYSAAFIPIGGRWFWLVTFLLHLIVDFFTSRLTSKLWFIDLEEVEDPAEAEWNGYTHLAKVHAQRRHWFFVVIGADQLLHFLALSLTWRYLG